MTRWPALGGLSALLLAGCGGSEVPPAARYGQVIWKEDTGVQRRAADLRACELEAIGLTPAATQERIDAATLATPAQEHDLLLRRCLAARGYRIVEFPVCADAEVPEAAVQRILATEDLPPAKAVRCITPDRGGFVPA